MAGTCKEFTFSFFFGSCESLIPANKTYKFNCQPYISLSECAEDEYRCRTNVCIPDAYTCDYLIDCDDGSDETVNCKLLFSQRVLYSY